MNKEFLHTQLQICKRIVRFKFVVIGYHVLPEINNTGVALLLFRVTVTTVRVVGLRRVNRRVFLSRFCIFQGGRVGRGGDNNVMSGISSSSPLAHV